MTKVPLPRRLLAAVLLLTCAFVAIALAVPNAASPVPSPPPSKEKTKHKAKAGLQEVGPVRLDTDGNSWAEKTLKRLSLEEKVGQMLMTSQTSDYMNVSSPDLARTQDMVRRYHMGGIVLTIRAEGPFRARTEPLEAAAWTNEIQKAADVPLFIAADFEYGINMRLNGGTPFPFAMAFGAAGDVASAEAFGRIAGQESRAIGVQWNFFPVADVNSNPANPIINTRSFGEDPAQVGALVAAYIRGAHESGMLTTAKHFPGHGDTATDSHLGLATVPGDVARLESVELPPFRQAIAAGTDAVMIAHVSVPALEPDPNKVATTSSTVVNGILKEKLGFKGIVITDAMDMNALTRLYTQPGQPYTGRAVVEAVKAGNDVILQPSNVGVAFDAIVAAVRSGEIPQSRIDEAVLKILRAKAAVGLSTGRFVDLDQVNERVATPDSMQLAQHVTENAITLLRDGGMLPLRREGTEAPRATYGDVREPGSRLLAVILTDDVRLDAGRALERELRARVPDVNVQYVDPRIASAVTEKIVDLASRAQSVLVAAYVTPTSGKAVMINGKYQNTVSLVPEMAALLHGILQRAAKNTAVVAVGSPYLAQDFPEVQTYMCTFSNTAGSETAAVKALFGENSVRGHLPVSIPNIAARGAGLERNWQAASGGSNGNTKGSGR